MRKKTPNNHETELHSKDGRDTQVLARLGKKSVLERRFSFLPILGFMCTVLITWEGSLILFTTGLTNGGSAGLVYGYLFVWIGTVSVFTTMAEMASMAPTTGGQYHWVWMLAPSTCRRFLSYVVGWLVMCGWQAILAGSGYLGGTMVVALIQLNHADYVPKLWQGTLTFWALIVLSVLVNTIAARILPQIEVLFLVLHIVGFFAILIPIVSLAPEKTSAHDVFTQFSNGGGWPTQGVSFFVGIVGSVFAMFGADSAVHMAEEVKNAEVIVPWSMVSSTILNGALGWAIIIAMLFVTPDITSALSSPTGVLGYPYMQIFLDATSSHAGSTVLISILIVITQTSTIALMATASRLVWAFARDRGLPGWSTVSKVEAKSSVPMLAIIVTSCVSCLIGLINLGSSTAFNDVVSLGVSSLYASYIITETLFLWRRTSGAIKLPLQSTHDSENVNQLIWGPFRLPRVLGIMINLFAVCFGLIILFFSFWPVATPVAAAHMNFSVLMTGSVTIFAIFYYVVWARRTYTGPIVEITSGSIDGSGFGSSRMFENSM